jgi:hypothetical protein
MSFDRDAESPPVESARPPVPQDDNTTLALAAGIVAALVAGGLWALAVRLTGYEIGYAAWAVGLLVGLAMARTTRNRSRELAALAAGFAILGLVVGKLFIFLGSTDAIAQTFNENDELMRGAVAWMLYEERALDAATLDEIDATFAAGDTISDALWAAMVAQAAPRLRAMSAAEREAVARDVAASVLQRMGALNGILAQASPFDVLWILLAVGTAYRLMLPAREEEPAPQPA